MMTGDEIRVFDARLADHHLQAARLRSRIDAKWAEMHRAAGDRQRYQGKTRVWDMDQHAVRAALVTRPAGPALTAELAGLHNELSPLLAEIDQMDKIYAASPWARFFECGNPDGHIHSSLRGCKTVYWDTMMIWCPELSARTEAEAVEKLGPHLCTVCFPSAPVEWHQSKADTEREANAAAKAAKQAARDAEAAIKNLTVDEQFDDEDGHTVTTVYGAKQVISNAAWMRHYNGVNKPHRFAADAEAAAVRARTALITHGIPAIEVHTLAGRADARYRKIAAKFTPAS
jgi:hypothetical protein